MRRKPKEILCPKCKVLVAHYDGKGTINVIAKCLNCRNRVVYHVDTGMTELKKQPSRRMSSGLSY